MYQFSVYSDYFSEAVRSKVETKARDMSFHTQLFSIIILIIRDIE